MTSGRSRASVSSTAVRSWRNDSSSSGIDFEVIKGRSGRFAEARTRGMVASTGRCRRARASMVGSRARRVRDAMSATKTAASTPRTADSEEQRRAVAAGRGLGVGRGLDDA